MAEKFPSRKELGAAGQQPTEYDPEVRQGSQEDQWHPGCYQKEIVFLSTGEIIPQVLCSVLGPSLQGQ